MIIKNAAFVIDKLRKESRYTRTELAPGITQIESGDDKYFIEKIDRSDSPLVEKSHHLLENTFKSDEVIPIDIFKYAIDGKLPNGKEQEVPYRAYAIRDEQGNVISVFACGYLSLRDGQERLTGEAAMMVGYAATSQEKDEQGEPKYRRKGLSKEAYITALTNAMKETHDSGKKLTFAVGQCTFTSEDFWNSVGWKRIYVQEGVEKYNYTELPYLPPVFDFDLATGKPTKGTKPVPEHLMVDTFGRFNLTKEKILQVSHAINRWFMWERELFANEEAYQNHKAYFKQCDDRLAEFLAHHGQIILLDKEGREAIRTRSKGVINEYTEADKS